MNAVEIAVCMVFGGFAIISVGKNMNSAYANLITALLIYVLFNNIPDKFCVRFEKVGEMAPFS